MDASKMMHNLSSATPRPRPVLSPLPGLHPPPGPPRSPTPPPPSPPPTTDGDTPTYEYILHLTPSLTTAQENAAIANMRNVLAQAGVENVLVEAEENDDDGKFWVVTTRVEILEREMRRVRALSGVEGFEVSDGLEDIV
ncbi:uncharacterized protein MYCGRDRAFT_94771 [Zymoseptoria tritici IPO323]|uniref:Uncharacterized protein n=1 Tax=Zymoseptoria tritici (strain CBS 115943 / IPO323) TaxID=336722 RepID=F9XF43_ZYMTI|nr:uncharacterized protein MYCGRDRAFT_94771 [Zymoseptoria tritici IPO323]EGP85859.1 hypothetical protein MYCGRDRAFT_94771 [Zymoseptoria tritici IPO323]